MRTKFLARAAALASIVMPVAAQAGPVIQAAACNAIASPAGCLFQGNINGNASNANNGYKAAEAAFNLFNDTHPGVGDDITLNFLFDADLNSSLIDYTGTKPKTGSWSVPGYTIDFIAVKAGNYFTLYKIDPASSGTWDVSGTPEGNKGLSHILFFGSQANAVPEPAAWGMLIGGFGLAGVAMRRRKTRGEAKLA